MLTLLGERIRRNQISRIEPLNLKMRNILIINKRISRFMERGTDLPRWKNFHTHIFTPRGR